MTTYSWLWLIWLALFAVIEGFALANRKDGDTLSEHVWDWFSIREKGTGWRSRRLVLLAFLAWLSLHMLTGGEF